MKKAVMLLAGWLVIVSGISWAGDDPYHIAMGDIISSYLSIREKLAADSLDGVAKEAQKISQQAETMDKVHAEHPRHSKDIHEKYMLISEIGKYAAQLSHGDIAAVRRLFGNLSQTIIKYVAKFGQPANISGNLFTYYCPMYPGYWLQESQDAANPFYGKAMLKCAELVEGAKKKQKMLQDIEKGHHPRGAEHKHK